MTVEEIDVSAAVERIKNLLKEERHLSPAFKAGVELLILIVSLLVNRLGRNSRNSSLPPSQDPHRERKSKSKGDKLKPGGQKGHKGTTLQKISNPHRIEAIEIDRRTIPQGIYTKVGYESRQVFDVTIGLCVIEYRAEILQEVSGTQYVAHFPEGVTKAAQYGNEVKAQSVYMSQFQLIPLARVQDHFNDQVGLPIAKGTISNFNREAYDLLEPFEAWARRELLSSQLIHADETGVNLDGKGIWLHNLSNEKVTLYHTDARRGKEGIGWEFCPTSEDIWFTIT